MGPAPAPTPALALVLQHGPIYVRNEIGVIDTGSVAAWPDTWFCPERHRACSSTGRVGTRPVAPRPEKTFCTKEAGGATSALGCRDADGSRGSVVSKLHHGGVYFYIERDHVARTAARAGEPRRAKGQGVEVQ